MNDECPYTMNVVYPDGSVMVVPEAEPEAAIMFARGQLEQGKWMRAELSDWRGDLVWFGNHGTRSSLN